jgi:hypothetical protein
MVVTVVVAQYMAAMNCATCVSSVRSWPAAQHQKKLYGLKAGSVMMFSNWKPLGLEAVWL